MCILLHIQSSLWLVQNNQLSDNLTITTVDHDIIQVPENLGVHVHPAHLLVFHRQGHGVLALLVPLVGNLYLGPLFRQRERHWAHINDGSVLMFQRQLSNTLVNLNLEIQMTPVASLTQTN